jgi:Uma2 family endonuclease
MSHLQVLLEPVAGELLPRRRLTREQCREFCTQNRDPRIERNSDVKISVMAPVHARLGGQNSRLTAYLTIWADQKMTGIAFDSSTGSNRAPDASWALKSRIAALTPEQRDDFLPLCPDFVAGIRSKSNLLVELHANSIFGDSVLPGFMLDLSGIWNREI